MKIDLVYMWADGNDPNWVAKRNAYLPPQEQRDVQSFCEARYVDNDELRYSLRSVEMYAPWINHIYIVTDGQTPHWLNTSNDKVSIIDHSELFPSDVLPTFNTTAIELVVTNIPGLSEYYLMANDDTMFGREIEPDFFFTKEGKMRVRVLKQSGLYRGLQRLLNRSEASQSTYDTIISNAVSLLPANWRNKFSKLYPHHNIDSYVKSSVLECIAKHKELYDMTLHNRFRTPGDLHRHLFTLYGVTSGHHVLEAIGGLKDKLQREFYRFGLFRNIDSLYVDLKRKDIKKQLKCLSPALVCFNDDEMTTESDRARLKELLNELYPAKSTFEK